MARPSKITLEEVQNAVDVLKSNDKPINPYQIKKIIGYGSEKKIAWFMSALDIDAEYEEEDPLLKQLARLLHPVAVDLRQTKDEAIKFVEDEYVEKLVKANDEIERLKGELNGAENNALEMEKKNEILIDKLNTREEELDKAARKIGEMEVFIAQLSTELKGSESANKKLEEDIDSLKTNLEQEEQKHQAGIDRLKEVHGQDIQLLRAEIEDWKNDLKQSAYNEEAAKIELSKVNTMLDNKSDELSNTQARVAKLTLKSVQQEETLSGKDTEITTLSSKVTELTDKSIELKERLDNALEEIKSLSEKEQTSSNTMHDAKANLQLSEQREQLLQKQVQSLEKIIERLTEQKNDD